MISSKKYLGVRRMEQLRGKLRQKKPNGPFYYRLTTALNQRKEFALKTCDSKEAIQKAGELDALWEAPTQEVAAARINAMKGFGRLNIKLPLADAWEKYAVHPDRATPHTVSEQKSYRATFVEFVNFASNPVIPGKKKNTVARIRLVSELTPALCQAFADYLRTTALAVDSHNRKIKRLRKIFECLSDYYDGENPFAAKHLLRSPREEQDKVVRRLAFTKEQEEKLRNVLADKIHRVINKPEIRVIYYLGMYTGQRLKDCVLLQWQNVDLPHDRLWVKQFKTGKEVTIPIAPQLREVLLEAHEWRIDQYVCPKTAQRYNKVDATGENIGGNLVNIDVLRVIKWIGLEPSVKVPGRDKKMTVYGFHSLRHSFASYCAEAGVPKAVLLSILGTDSDIADKYYTHVGDEAQIKAISAISGKKMQTGEAAKIQKVLALLDTHPSPSEGILAQIRTILEQ